jgi:hypothetical protein
MFCAPGLVFGGAEDVGTYFPVLRSRTHFRQYRGRRVPFSNFALPDSFSAVSRASVPVFMFCAHELIFGGTVGVGSSFHILRSRIRFRRYRGRQVKFSCFAHPDSFSAVLRASGPAFMFCAPGLILGGTEDVGSRFEVLRSRTHFRGYRGRRVPFLCFAIPKLVFGDTEGAASCFHVMCSRTRFRRYRVRRVPFSCFARPDSFSAVPWASGPVFMLCAPGLLFGGTEGVGSRFHILRAPTPFRLYRGRRVPFSCFAFPESFSAVPRTPRPVFMLCAPGLVFGGIECVGARFHVLRARTLVRR